MKYNIFSNWRLIISILAFLLLVSSIVSAGDSEHFSNFSYEKEDSYVFKFTDFEIFPETFPAEISDWSYSMAAPVLSSLKIADLNRDNALDVICTSYGPQPNPYGSGQIAVLDVNGNPLPGWPIITSGPIPASAAIGDVDNDGDNELVVGDWNAMYIYNHDGTLYDGWSVGTGTSYSPALEDLDGDGDLEIIHVFNNILYVRHHDGSIYSGFPVSAPENIGSPALADLNNDNELEIIAGTLAGPVGPDPYEVYVWKLDGSVLAGFPVSTSGVVKSTPAVGDIDNDNQPEIVVASYHTSNNDYIYCWDHEGNAKPGWPVRAMYCRLSSPALGDVDGDDDLEIFIGGLITTPDWIEILYGYHHNGEPIVNWPVELPHDGGVANINSSPVIAEIDNDVLSPEIFIKVNNNIFGLNSDGSLLDNFPYFLSDDGASGTHSPSPAIGDLDNDGDADYVFASSSGNIEFIDGSGEYNSELSFWPMFKHDAYNTGCYGFIQQTYVESDIMLPVYSKLLQNYPNPFNAQTTISFALPEACNVELTIFNLLGQVVEVLIDDYMEAGSKSVIWDAGNVSSGMYFYKIKTGSFTDLKKMTLLK